MAEQDVDQLLKQILEQAQQIIPFDWGGIGLLNPGRDALVPRAYLGGGGILPPTVALGEGVVGWVAETGQIALISDVTQDDRYIAADPDVRSALAVPLQIDDQVIGVFIVESHALDAYTQEHTTILSALADLAALTLHAAQLYTDLQENYEVLTETYLELAVRNEISRLASAASELDQMLPAMLDGLVQLVVADAATLVLWEPDRNRLRRLVTSGLSDPPNLANIVFTDDLVRQVIQAGQPTSVTINEESPFKTVGGAPAGDFTHVLGIPLMARGRAVGAACLLRGEGGLPFSEGEITRATALAYQVALAIDNNLLLENTRQRLRETEMLRRVAHLAGSTLAVDTLLHDVVAETAAFLNADVAMVWLPDLVSNELALHKPSACGLPEDYQPPTWPIDGEGLVATIYRTLTPHVSNAPWEECSAIVGDEIAIQNMAVLPIISRGQVTGVLILANKSGGDFEPDHLQVLEAVSNQIGVTMDNARLYTTESKRAELMHLINLIGSELTSVLDLEELFRRVVARIHEMLHYEVVYLFLREGPELELRASAGPEARPLMKTGYRLPITKGIVGRTVRTARSYITRDVLLDPDYFEPEAMAGLRSALSVPIKSGERVVGALDVLSSEVAAFDESDRKAAETLAAQIAIAIENARLYEETQQRLLEQGILYQIGQDLISILDVQELAEMVARHMARALDTTGCLLQLYDADTDTLALVARHVSTLAANPESLGDIPESCGLSDFQAIARAMHTRNPLVVHVNDPNAGAAERTFLESYQQQATLIIPMIAGDRVAGLVQWLEDRQIRTFSEGEIRLAQTLVNQAATALEKARLYEETQRQLNRETLLRGIAEAVSTTLDRDALTRRFAEEVGKALHAVESMAMALEGDTLHVQARYKDFGAPDTSKRRDAYPLDQYPTLRRALDSGESLLITTAGAPSNQPEADDLRASGYTSALFTPLISHDQVLGALMVCDERPTRRFDADDQTLLEALANQLAVAMDNARLYQAEHRRRQLLEKIQDASQALVGELQPQSLMDMIVSKVSEVFATPAASLTLLDETGETLIVRAAQGLSERYVRERRIPLQTLLSAGVGESASRPIVYTDLEEIAGRQQELIAEEHLQTAVVVPLVRRNNILGALCLYTKDTPHMFGEEDLEMMQLLARQIATAIDNASLFEMLELRAHELQEASRLKSEFLANISHELRTPLNSIIGFSETLLSGLYGPLTDKQSNRLDTVRRNAYHLLTLIDDLLDISRIEAGRMELEAGPVNVAAELQHVLDVIEPQAIAKKLALLREIPDDLPQIQGDAQRLRQIFTNLLANAVKFTDQGRIVVRAQYVGNGAGEIVLSFEDTGIGIAESDLDIIFDEFRQADGSSTRQYEGTGLGLAICKKLVGMMGGRIWVESEPGIGSTFYVALPITKDALDESGSAHQEGIA